METVASTKTETARLIELEQHVASVMARYREFAADARVGEAIAARLQRVIPEALRNSEAVAWESAVYWLVEGDARDARKRVKDWAALDFGPALERFIANRRRWLDPERDPDMPAPEVVAIRKELVAAEELRAERDRAEAEAAASS